MEQNVEENSNRDEEEGRSERPEVELYDPFSRSFATRKREDPLLRLYDKKIVGEDF